MSWVWWLLAPLLVTLLVAVLTWLAGRPRRPPTSEEAVSSHRRFLADLGDLADASALTRRTDSARRTESAGRTADPGSSGAVPVTERPDKLPG